MPPRSKKNIMTPLNLPPSQLQLRADADGGTSVYDPLRHRWVLLTPEEWVRQHFVAMMAIELGYPPALMSNEVSVKLNGLSQRCDTVVWSSADGSPLMIVEYKAPSVEITKKVFDQIVRYNLVLRAPYLMVSNGLRHFCCRVDPDSGSYTFLAALPSYSEL